MLAKSCSRSQGQPPCGSRRRAMTSSSSRMSAMRRHRLQPLAPGQRGVTQGDEVRVEQGFLAVVLQRLAVQIEHGTAGGLEHALGGGGVPFDGRAETRLVYHALNSDPAELHRNAQK